VPPEVLATVDGMEPGRALELGSGTGSIVLDLARRGWFATGVEPSSSDVESARRKADWTAGATFVEGDVTELSRLGVDGPFDLVIDAGAYDAVPENRRDAYAREVARVARPGARFLLFATTAREGEAADAGVRGRFAGAFEVAPGEAGREAPNAAWYTLTRRVD
jgi:cyclopropane fatty-acyl-phospholipid synthase-like methyltransferase